MIHFRLHCEHEHEFEGWFRNNEDFAHQNQSGLIECPFCGSLSISKSLMAPAVVTRGQNDDTLKLNDKERDRHKALRDIISRFYQNAHYVGARFAEEARQMHFGEKERRSIYGEASDQDIATLLDDGVDIIPLPRLPEKQH
ncbi:DUF1178 family protein [Bartonella sp. DGB2]|uniref:DUF1178 family protein n=1 Tax=Bartonella sp. DGB2 TaxID=3388426 RepID=UPI0039902BDD